MEQFGVFSLLEESILLLLAESKDLKGLIRCLAPGEEVIFV